MGLYLFIIALGAGWGLFIQPAISAIPKDEALILTLVGVMSLWLVPLYFWTRAAIEWARKRFGSKPRFEATEE